MTAEYRQPFRGDYAITQDFGEIVPGVTYNGTPHTGIDYACPLGTPILASADGTVMFAGEAVSGYGKYIIICHIDGSGTVYAHLSEILVRQWQSVKQGDVIGRSGNSGYSTGPHLHFEWRRKANDINTAEDPKLYLRNVLDTDPTNNTPTTVKPQFEALRSGPAIVVADVVNARCHCDMSNVRDQLHKGDIISIGDEVTEYMGLPFRDFWDPHVNCWLRIAEHDPDTQLIRNYEIK